MSENTISKWLEKNETLRCAPVNIYYSDGEIDRKLVAKGEIDRVGNITTNWLESGEKERIERVISELNETESFWLKGGSYDKESGQPALTKTKSERGMPGFLEALVQSAERFYGLEFVVDEERDLV